MTPVVHERDEWLAQYDVADGESQAWWGGNTWPGNAAIDNLTWHYPGGIVDQSDPGAEIRKEQADYHRRRDGNSTGRPFPFDLGYDLGYNAMIDLSGGIWKVRWTDKRCAANGTADANGRSFAIQFMIAGLNDDVTPAQLASARWLDAELRRSFPNIPAGAAGHKGHRDWFSTACPGDVIFRRVTSGDFLARAERRPPQPPSLQGDDDMRFKLFKAKGFFDIIAVGPGNPFNPGSPQAAQELVDKGQVASGDGSPVAPGTPFISVVIEISQPLWEAMSGLPLTAPR